jgi:hypothetical protein
MNLRTIVIALVAAVAGALITLAVVRGGGAKAAADEKPPAETQSAERVTSAGGETVVTIDAATAARNRIEVTAVQAGQRSDATATYATAVDVRDLVDARNQLGAGRAQEAQSHARVAAATAEYERLKVLHDDNRNVSDRVLQESEASLRGERAGIAAADAAIRAASSGVEQRWGSVIARAFNANASWIDDLIANRRVLVQVVSDVQPPQRVTLQAGNASVAATFVSPAVRSDAHIQGRSWFYLAPAGAIVPGMTLSANVSAGTSQSGAIVPHDAVVWSGGRSWIYVERSPNQFARRAVDASVPMTGGYFVTNIAPGQRVVTSGAQQLLSEESKPQVEE